MDLPIVSVAICALINSSNEILLANSPKYNLWEFPGGKLEENETPEQAIIRELDEELGIKVAFSDLKPVTFIRPLSRVASEEEFEGDATRRTGMYKEVHEDSRIDSTYKLPSEVEFGKRSISFSYPNFHAILFLFSCTKWQGEPKPIEGQELKWVKISELDNYPMHKANTQILDRLKKIFKD
jgi:8-oxo-dGTP diphosphatase